MSVIQGLLVEWTPQKIQYVRKYVGEPHIPQDVKRRRRQVYDMMRHMGAPVLVKHQYNADDVEKGLAVRSQNLDPVYGQTRRNDPLSHGVGFVSAETHPEEWVTPEGEIVKSKTQPTGAVRAPKYRGFGPGRLLYIIQPDAAEDLFKVDSAGAFIKVQSALAQAPWYPEMNDNDLIINVEIDKAGRILDTYERYQAKMSTPVSMRGYDREGRREYTEGGGNRFVMNQQFEMTHIPDTDELYKVETDR